LQAVEKIFAWASARWLTTKQSLTPHQFTIKADTHLELGTMLLTLWPTHVDQSVWKKIFAGKPERLEAYFAKWLVNEGVLSVKDDHMHFSLPNSIKDKLIDSFKLATEIAQLEIPTKRREEASVSADKKQKVGRGI
jgi:hypothetical protein